MKVKAEHAVNKLAMGMGLVMFAFLTFSFTFLALHG